MDKFEVVKLLGKGAFASVFQVRRKDDNQLYALKRVNVQNMSISDKEHALNEIRILASFSHPNIISFKESFYSEETKSLDIIMEYAEEGDILSLINKTKTNRTMISENTIWTYLIQMLIGLKALHEKKFIHRDLKSANVFICKDDIAKIGDFNVAKRLKYSTYMQSQTGTPYYASPEIWLEKPYDMRTDLWSLGCIVYQMCTLQVPFQAHSIPALCKTVTKGEYRPIPFSYSKSLEIILSELLVTDMNQRKTSDELLRHPLVTKKMEILNIKDTPVVTNLLDTIKLPKNQDDFNSVLPKVNKYSSEIKLISVLNNNQYINPLIKERAQSTKIMGRIQLLQKRINNINHAVIDLEYSYNNNDNSSKEQEHQLPLTIMYDNEREENKKEYLVNRNERGTVKISYCLYKNNNNNKYCKHSNAINPISKRLNSVFLEKRMLNNQKYERARDCFYPNIKKIYHV